MNVESVGIGWQGLRHPQVGLALALIVQREGAGLALAKLAGDNGLLLAEFRIRFVFDDQTPVHVDPGHNLVTYFFNGRNNAGTLDPRTNDDRGFAVDKSWLPHGDNRSSAQHASEGNLEGHGLAGNE